MERRDLLKLFGIGSVIAPVIGGAAIKLIQEPKFKIVPAQGTALFIGDGASPQRWTKIANVKTISPVSTGALWPRPCFKDKVGKLVSKQVDPDDPESITFTFSFDPANGIL